MNNYITDFLAGGWKKELGKKLTVDPEEKDAYMERQWEMGADLAEYELDSHIEDNSPKIQEEHE